MQLQETPFYKTEDKKIRSFQSIIEAFVIALRLGLTSFGGPIAHLNYFHKEYVIRRKWIDEQSYADLVSMCQFLPGPISSKVGIALGILRAGLLGGFVTWLGFTLPSALAMTLFAYFTKTMKLGNLGWLHGLMVVAVAVVAQAVWSMGKTMIPDRKRATIAFLVTIITILWPTALGQIVMIAASGLLGVLLFPATPVAERETVQFPISRSLAAIAWIVLFTLLLGLPILEQITHNQFIAMIDGFYRAGALVFGSGHLILPFLDKVVVSTGWITNTQFIAGYGAAQAVPGPLSTFATYLGMTMHGWVWGVFATAAIFSSCFFYVLGTLPFWSVIRKKSKFQCAFQGINAGVMGILLAAFYNPIWTSTIKNPSDFCLGLAAFGLLVYWKVPAWVVVLLSCICGAIIPSIS